MSGSWVYATHPDTGGETRFPDDPDVIAAQEARGWIVGGDLPPHLDPEARDLAPVAPVETEEPPAAAPADETPTPSEKSTTSSKTKRTPAASAGDDTNGAASA